MQKIQNQWLAVTVSELGAELQNIIKLQDNCEYLWQGNPLHWGKRSPVLFPIVGSLIEDTYYLDGKPYRLPRHGLARTKKFTLIAEESDLLVYRLTADTDSMEVYPFEFSLQISYKLEDQRLVIDYQLDNLSGEEECWFSIGAHPAFNCPLLPGDARSQYSLHFEQPQRLVTQVLNEQGIRDGQVKTILNEGKAISITDDLFADDALIFNGLSCKKISLQKEDEKFITVDFENFQYLGIWSASNSSPFICIEPWLGVSDHLEHNQELKEKEGIISVEANGHFSASYEIFVH